MYKNYSFILFLHVNIFCDLINAYKYTLTQENCNKVEENSSMLQLKRHLLCEYDSDVRPVESNKNVTRVHLEIRAGFREYNQYTHIFSLHTVTFLTWEDMHLTWKPEHYDGIDLLTTTCDEIWLPDIIVYNEYAGRKQFSTQSTCWVNNDGMVEWELIVKYSVYCIGDTTWWPYDVLNCTLQLGSLSHSDDEIKFIADEIIDYEDRENPEWRLINTSRTDRVDEHKYNVGSDTNKTSYHFIMVRNWGIICIAYVTPIIVLMVMTLITLWLEPKSTERMIMANLNFICHLLCMEDVHWLMSRNGFNIPKLLIFYESSFAIASFTLILTSILRHLQELSTEPPVWISTITTSILHSKVGQIFLVNVLDPVTMGKIEINADDNTNLMQVDNKKSSWTYVTVLIGWLALLSVSLAYVILLSIYFPVYKSY